MTLRKGVLVLSEARSGSTWLGRLATNAKLGCGEEWLQPEVLGLDPAKTDRDTYFESALDKATNNCAGFCFKVFPQQLFLMNEHYNTDFIGYCKKRYDVSLALLTRRDRLRQAISYARGIQTKKFASDQTAKREAKYNFDQISRCYFHIERGYAFWDSYLAIVDPDSKHLVYEDLVDNPAPFLNFVADCLGEPHPTNIKTDMKIQRDGITEEWLERFKQDISESDFLHNASPSRMPEPTLKNAYRFIRGERIHPHPYLL